MDSENPKGFWDNLKDWAKIGVKFYGDNVTANKVKTQKKKVASINKVSRQLEKLDKKISIHIAIAVIFFILGFVISYITRL